MTAFRGLFAALVAAQLAYGAAPRRSPSATRALVLLMLATAMAEAAQARGWRRGLPSRSPPPAASASPPS